MFLEKSSSKEADALDNSFSKEEDDAIEAIINDL